MTAAGSISGVPVSVALLAGALATLNPCGFPVLSAFLSYTLGVGPVHPPRTPTRVAQGLAAGLLVAAGFLGVFTAIALPLGYGVAAISEAVPWVGLAFGATLFVFGVATLVGRGVALPGGLAARFGIRRHVQTRVATSVLFGVSYGVASLGCSLPVFLTLLGAALGGGGSVMTLVVFAAYGTGTAIVLMALSVGVVLVRGGLNRWVRPAMPYMQSLSGVLLAVAGGYLLYYWLRVGFGAPAAAASDPLVSVVAGFATWIEARAEQGAAFFMATVLILLAAAVGASLWPGGNHRRPLRHHQTTGADDESIRDREVDDVSGHGRDSDPTPSPRGWRTADRARLVIAGLMTAALLGALVGYRMGAGTSDAADSTDVSARSVTREERTALHNDGPAGRLSEFTGLEQLQALFDEKASSPRMIALLSPTCITCLRGAHWLQEQLAQQPNADVQVYAIWFSILPGDDRAEWDGQILNDPRVTHLWDNEQVTGRWFAARGYGNMPVQWDALFLYGPASRWNGNDEPSDLLFWRRPIIAHTKDLTEQMRPLLEGP